MRLFGTKPIEQRSKVPWIVTWRDREGRFPIDFPIRVIAAIDSACNGPNACRAGVLLGSIQRDEAGDEILHIVHAIPLEIGEEGQLSSVARERLAACRPASGRSVMTVGLFVPAAVGEPHNLCALVASCKPLFPASMAIAVVSQNGVARLHEWQLDEDEINPMSPDLRLRAARPEETGLTAVSGTVGQPLRPMPALMPATIAQPLDAGVTTVQIDVPRWSWVGLLLLVTCMLGAGIWYVRTPAPAQPNARIEIPERKGLDLQVSGRGSDLLINWNRDLETTIGARHGMLQITDGGEPQYLPLSIRDLSSGQVLYVPHSRDLKIEFTAFTESTSLHETVRVIQAEGPRAAETIQPPVLRAREAVAPPRRSAPVPPAVVVIPGSTLTSTPAAGETKVSEVAREIVLPPPDAIRLEPAEPPVANAVQQPPERSVEQTAVKPVQAAPVNAAPQMADFHPPVPTRQVTPVLPDTVKRILFRDTPVSVKLRIDANGNVLSAAAESGSGVNGLLAKVAEDTARSWRFRAATLGGRPTPADYMLTFMFRTAAR